MADYNQNIDYAAEIKRIKAQDPNANVNSLIDAGLAKLNASPDLQQKYGAAWDQLANQYRTNVQQAPTVAMASPQASAQDYINQLNEARKQQTIAALGKSRDESLSRLNAEKATIQPRYYDARNEAAAGSQQQARNFAEYMAARGGSTGAAAQAELSRVGTLQGTLGNLGRQETAAYDDIDRRTTDVHNAYNSDLASAQAGIEADRMSALLQDFYIAQQRGDTLAQNAIQNELARAGMTGYLGGQRTLQGQAFDAQQAQQQWDNTFRTQQFDFQKAQQLWENTFQEKSFEQSVKQEAARMGLNWAQLNQNQQQFLAEMAFKNKAQDLEREKFSFQKSQTGGGLSQDQVNKYDALLQAYSKYSDPQDAYNYATSPQGKLNALNYGLTDGLYNQLVDSLKGKIPKSPTAGDAKNGFFADAVSELDKMTPDQRVNFFNGEKTNIIREYGIDTYNKLYNSYYDNYGNPK